MALRGIVKGGEAFCMECKSPVDHDAGSCPSCGTMFDDEVRAFSCPRCDTVLPLGTSECPQCGMKFRIKALRERIAPGIQDEVQIAEESEDAHASSEVPSESIHDESAVERADVESPVSAKESEIVRELADGISELDGRRAEFLSKLKQKKEGEPKLSKMRSASDAATRHEFVESEIISLADEIVDITEFRSILLSFVKEVSTMVEPLEMIDEKGGMSLSARTAKILAEAGGLDVDQTDEREDQLTKREEMVNRKIRGYASKKKELEDREAEIAAKVAEFERERSAQERTHGKPQAEPMEPAGKADEWEATEAAITSRVMKVCKALSDGSDESASAADVTAESGLVLIEEATMKLISDNQDFQTKLKETAELESETRRLLEVLDQLLGSLPEEVIEKFTQSEDYKLYERMLDRYKI